MMVKSNDKCLEINSVYRIWKLPNASFFSMGGVQYDVLGNIYMVGTFYMVIAPSMKTDRELIKYINLVNVLSPENQYDV